MVDGTVFTTSGGNITVSADDNLAAYAMSITGGAGAVTLIANTMAINTAIAAAGQTVTLKPNTASTSISIGTNAATTGTLDLTDTELDYISAANLTIGSTTDSLSGAISIGDLTQSSKNLTINSSTGNITVFTDEVEVTSGNLIFSTGGTFDQQYGLLETVTSGNISITGSTLTLGNITSVGNITTSGSGAVSLLPVGYNDITIDQTYVDSDLTDFPVLIKLTDGTGGLNLANTAANGSDLRFFAQNGEHLAYEIEGTWSNSPSATNWVWVKVPSISGTVNTTFRMYHGNTGTVKDARAATEVWDTNFKMVQHLEEASGNATDSTTNNNFGSVVGADYSTTGKIGNAYDFNGSTDYVKIDTGTALSMGGTQAMTLSAWVKSDVAGTDAIISKFNANVAGEYFLHLIDSGAIMGHREVSPWNVTSAAGEVGSGTGNFHYITMAYDGTNLNVYEAGALVATGAMGSMGTTTTAVLLGAEFASSVVSLFLMVLLMRRVFLMPIVLLLGSKPNTTIKTMRHKVDFLVM